VFANLGVIALELDAEIVSKNRCASLRIHFDLPFCARYLMQVNAWNHIELLDWQRTTFNLTSGEGLRGLKEKKVRSVFRYFANFESSIVWIFWHSIIDSSVLSTQHQRLPYGRLQPASSFKTNPVTALHCIGVSTPCKIGCGTFDHPWLLDWRESDSFLQTLDFSLTVKLTGKQIFFFLCSGRKLLREHQFWSKRAGCLSLIALDLKAPIWRLNFLVSVSAVLETFWRRKPNVGFDAGHVMYQPLSFHVVFMCSCSVSDTEIKRLYRRFKKLDTDHSGSCLEEVLWWSLYRSLVPRWVSCHPRVGSYPLFACDGLMYCAYSSTPFCDLICFFQEHNPLVRRVVETFDVDKSGCYCIQNGAWFDYFQGKWTFASSLPLSAFSRPCKMNKRNSNVHERRNYRLWSYLCLWLFSHISHIELCWVSSLVTFNMYDCDHDGFISNRVLFALARSLTGVD